MSLHPCVYGKGPSIFVVFGQHVELLRRYVPTVEKERMCVHTYDNGYLVTFKSVETWTICVLILEHANIFCQKFL
jgi:hypothetical protein